MPSHVPPFEMDLGRLHYLAQELFHTVCDAYGPPLAVTVHFEECDALAENPHTADVVVRTLVTAQMLRYATRHPKEANPRYVVGFGLFADDLIPSLLEYQQRQTSPATADRLHEIRKEICGICDRLIMSTPPGMDRFGD
jgi:hypothetical protein